MKLEELLVTLREHGVCRYKGPVDFGPIVGAMQEQVELELFQHAPAKAAELSELADRNDQERAQRAVAIVQVPEPLRAVMDAGEFQAAVARARARFGDEG